MASILDAMKPSLEDEDGFDEIICIICGDLLASSLTDLDLPFRILNKFLNDSLKKNGLKYWKYYNPKFK